MIACDVKEAWTQFLEYVKKRCSETAFSNWFASISVHETSTDDEIVLEVPNVFVQDYILTNYKADLCAFLPVKIDGQPAVKFVVAKRVETKPAPVEHLPSINEQASPQALYQVKLNDNYHFDTLIEGPYNQFVKSAAMGIARKPGSTYNPLFIHGGVGLGKTHILHSIGHYIQENHKKLRVQCITTEGFINELVDSLRKKSIEKMKRFYREKVDVLLVDDIQFLQNRLNFEEEFCNMFEIFFNSKKQVVITSDKPPSQLKLSERLVARMEWGLVAHMGQPDLETRVAILQHKAELKGLHIGQELAFFIAENIHHNIRQLEGALNRLSAHCRLLNLPLTEEVVEQTLRQMFNQAPTQRISVEEILKAVAAVFQVRLIDLRGGARTKEIALPRQVAMFLAKEMIQDSLMAIGGYFGKTHSTILHACKNIQKKIDHDDLLKRQVDMVRRNIAC